MGLRSGRQFYCTGGSMHVILQGYGISVLETF